MKRTRIFLAAIVAVLLVGVAAGVTNAAPARHHYHHRIVRLHNRIDRLQHRLSLLRIKNRELRGQLAARTPAASQDTSTITYHVPATTAPDGFQCAEITNTHRVLVSSLSTMPTFINLLRGSTSIVVNRADGSSTTYAYDQAEAPYDPCSDPSTGQ